jgi:hypothetical protein
MRVPDPVQRSPGDAKHRPVRGAAEPRPIKAANHAARHSASKTRVNALTALRAASGERPSLYADAFFLF